MFRLRRVGCRGAAAALARDRVGVEAASYPAAGIVFGSERSPSRGSDVPRDWRPDAIDAYLTLLYVPAPATIYKGIHKLEPGHVLVAERGAIRTSRYWDLHFSGDGDARREDDYLEQLDALLAESVALRQIADVPLGAFLSGGIDSSAVAAYMVETSSRPPLTISVGFDHARYDELAHAKRVADHLACEFHPMTVTPDIVSLLPKLAWHFDELFADSSAVLTYYVSKASANWSPSRCRARGDELWPAKPGTASNSGNRTRQGLGPATAAAELAGRCPSVKGARAPASRVGLRQPTPNTRMACSEPDADPPLLVRLRRQRPRCRSVRHLPRRLSPLPLTDPADRGLYTDVHTTWWTTS